MTTTRTKIRRFRVYRCCTEHWVVDITRGFEGNYEYEYIHCSTWRAAYDHAYDVAKTWRYPEGWYR